MLEAQHLLGELLYSSKLVERNEAEASLWLHLAAQNGKKDSERVLKEMELFADSAAVAEGKQRAAAFSPVVEVKSGEGLAADLRAARKAHEYGNKVQALAIITRVARSLPKLGGQGMLTLRTLTGGLGIITVVLLYGLIRQASRSGILALVSALMLVIYPQAVLYSRFGFSYNLLTPLLLLVCLGLWHYLDASQVRWLILSFLSIGLGADRVEAGRDVAERGDERRGSSPSFA